MASPKIPETTCMKAIQVVEFNKPYAINTVPVPTELSPHDLLVKIAVASHCHTDTMVLSGAFRPNLPCIASHEGAGTVVAVGSSVKNFRPGDRVMCGLPSGSCGTCDDCTGDEKYRQYCPNFKAMSGVLSDGFFAEYARCDARWTTRLPDKVSLLDAAPLACAGRTVWRGVLQAGLKEGESLAIVGSGGGLGHLGIQFAKAMGLKVLGIDARDEGLAMSKEFGAHVVIDARKGKDDVVTVVQAVTDGGGADATLVLAEARDAVALSCAVTKVHGTVVQIAQPEEIVIPFREIVFRDIRLRGSLLSSPEESNEMVEFIAKHGLNVKTKVFYGLDKIEELVKVVKSGKLSGKAAIVVDKDQIEHERASGGSI